MRVFVLFGGEGGFTVVLRSYSAQCLGDLGSGFYACRTYAPALVLIYIRTNVRTIYLYIYIYIYIICLWWT